MTVAPGKFQNKPGQTGILKVAARIDIFYYKTEGDLSAVSRFDILLRKTNNIFIMSFISLHKPSNLDFSSQPFNII